ncbi:hypothetical protein C0992_010910 [Termitomyces sp. T32_za158]|nr:hypothetical protein C0992_010910 [Termitomyces sp. T32_za158]
MYGFRAKVRPENRQALDLHLYKRVFYELELLLRSTKTFGEEIGLLPELERLRDQYTCQEEERIHADLQKIAYTLDSPATVSLVTGQGRIERYIYPLIYMLLQHDLEIVQLACKHNLHAEEFQKMEDSMSNIFLAFDARRHDLTAIFQQTHGDLERKFENHAFGMFEKSYKLLPWAASESNLESVWKKLPQESDSDDIIENISTDVLKYSVQQPPDYPKPDQFINEDCDNKFGTLEGLWAGCCASGMGMTWFGGIILLDVEKTTGSTFSGKVLFSDRANPVHLRGSSLICEQGTTRATKVSLELGDRIQCSGIVNETCTKITGGWQPSPFSGDCSEPFCFTRTPAHLVRFRYTENELEKDRSRARWNFASTAVLHEVKRQRFSKDFVITRLQENKRLKELTIKREVYIRRSLSTEEFKELINLQRTMSPKACQFFFAVVQYILERLPYRQ